MFSQRPSACLNIYSVFAPMCAGIHCRQQCFSAARLCVLASCETKQHVSSLSTVDMQSVDTASAVQQAYREAYSFQSNIPRHCACPLSPLIQGAVRIRL